MRANAEEESLEGLVYEIRKIRLRRFFSLPDAEFQELLSKHESMVSFLYELYRRYGRHMDSRMKSAVAIHILSDADFHTVYDSLKEDASNWNEVLEHFKDIKKVESLSFN